MTNEPDSTGTDSDTSRQYQAPEQTPNNQTLRNQSPSNQAPSSKTPSNQTPDKSRTFAPRPSLGRGFGAYMHPQTSYGQSPSAYSASSSLGQPTAPVSRKDYASTPPPTDAASASPDAQSLRSHPFAWLMPWRTKQPSEPVSSPRHPLPLHNPPQPSPSQSTVGLAEGRYHPPESVFPEDAYREVYREGQNEEGQNLTSPDVQPAPQLWERQPYALIAHLLIVSSAFTIAWLLGILVAQILPGRLSEPPLQESLLRKSSRVTRRLWHFSQLWHTPTTQVRIDAIPLPETGPILKPVELSPFERQPLIDELNAIDTEIVTLDRRLRSLEKQLGSAPYRGTGIENRIETMRAAIDPPMRSESAPNAYEPTAREPNEMLLEVAQLQITLPSDALFEPGEPDLKAAALLEGLLDQLVNYPEATISVRVHSDNQATAIASREYTLAQANTLARYLQRNLPTTHRWIPVGMGAAQPVDDNMD
ncbi:MAG: hypothetical protein AAGB19_21220, partial [Cyanobacteria bacterium P01_F01_bin.3]